MKRKLLILSSALLIAAMLAGCAGTKSLSDPGSAPPAENTAQESAGVPSPSLSPEPEPSASVSAGIVQITDHAYEYKTQYIETHVVLPLVSGPDGDALEKINDVFRELMASAEESNKRAEAESKNMVEEGYGAPVPYMLDISYSVPYNKNDILCILLSNYSYFGGAHGGVEWIPYIFDTKTGEELGLNDLMQSGSGYREYINSVIREEIDKRIASGDVYELAEFSDIGDTPWFYLSGQGLVFFFQQYEYFPYASGIQQFDIPYADLAAMLKAEYAGLEITPVMLEEGGNTIAAGDIGRAVLSGNPSTGYSWKYEIQDESILELCGTDFQSKAADGTVGAGGSYTFDFRATMPGTTTIIFSYTQDWESGTSASPETVQFTVTVA